MQYTWNKIVLALLLAFVGGFAWNTKGLVDCNGLFLLDQNDRRASASYCMASDSLQAGNWMVQGGYGFFSLDASWRYDGESALYSWSLAANRDLNLGYASVATDFRFLNFRLDVASLPFFMASTHWNAPDSVAFAGAYYGRGKLDSIHVKWKSASSLNIIPVLEGYFEDEFQFRRFDVGSRVGRHRMDVGLTYGNTDPRTDRQGYVFSDSSEFWAVDPHYFYGSVPNEFSVDYFYVYLDQNYFALLRENESEKRFLYLPVGMDLNFLRLNYKRYTKDRNKKDAYGAVHGMYAQLDLNVPWESRRFYETMAPNRALTSSIIKTLSFSVFTRSFRVYGSGAIHFADAGGEYSWDVGDEGWHLKSSVGLDLFYVNANVELFKRTETRNALHASHFTDTLSWDVDVVGSMVSAGLGVVSPKERFFASVDASQVVPFYYSIEKYPPVKTVVVVPPENPEEPGTPIIEDTPNVSENNVSNVNKFFQLFKNGFMVRAKVGFFF